MSTCMFIDIICDCMNMIMHWHCVHYQSYCVHYIPPVSWNSRFQWRWQFFIWRRWQGYRVSLVDNFGLWLTPRVGEKLMSSVLLLLLSDHLLLIGFRSHSQPLRRIIINQRRSVILRNFLMSHIGSVECYVSRRIKSFPRKSVVCVRLFRRTSNGSYGEKCQRKKTVVAVAGGISGWLWRQRQRYRVLPLSTSSQH